MINKKGEVQQMVLVLMILSLCFWALFNFYTHSDKVKSEIIDSYLLGKVYSQELNLESQAYFKVRSEFINNYAKSNMNFDSGENLNKKIIDNMDEISIDTQEGPKKIVTKIDNNFIQVSIDQVQINGATTLIDKKRIWMWGIIPMQSYDQIRAFIAVVYRVDPYFSINIENEGLHSFDKIESSISSCNNSIIAEMNSCLESNLFNFNVKVEVQGEKRNVHLESKKQFLIDNSISRIKFDILA